MFFYPAFVLYFVSPQAFALINIQDVRISYEASSCIDEEVISTDSEVIKYTWKKANKDGSPDRRFADNYQIPVLNYGDIRVHSNSGLNEAYLISNAVSGQGFADAFTKFQHDLLAVTA